MIAGYTLLSILKEQPELLQELDDKTAYLKQGLDEVLRASQTPYVINHLGSMISVHFFQWSSRYGFCERSLSQ